MKYSLNATIMAVLIAVPIAAWPGAGHAGGLLVPGTGTEAMGRGGAFVAKADDPSALHHNPAGLAKLVGTVVHIGSNFLRYALEFDRAGVYELPDGIDEPYEGQDFQSVKNRARPDFGLGRFQAVPLVAVSSDLGGLVPGLRLGGGILAPNAAPGRDFGAYEFEAPGVAPPPQRYDVINQDAVVVLPSLAVAYSIMDKLDIGARFSAGFASVQSTSYTWVVRNYEEWIGDDAEFSVDVSDSFIPVFGLGVLYRPIPAIEIGASYTSAIPVRAQGEGRALLASVSSTGGGDEIVPLDPGIDPGCAAGGQENALKSCIDFDLPQTATLGVRWVIARDASGEGPAGAGSGGREIADIELDVKWENWSSSSASDYDVVVDGQSNDTGLPLRPTIVRHGFQDVFSIRLGGSYALPVADRALVARAGIAHDTAAAPDSFQRVDVDGAARTTLSTGLSYRISRFRIEAAGALVLEGDRTVEACEPNLGTEGCPPGSGQAPAGDRESPDPLQPVLFPEQAFQDPFNGGEYSSSYLMFSLGLTAWF